MTLDTEFDPEIIMWDYETATMWAWVATEDFAGQLITIDIDTGKRLKTVISYPNLSANGGTEITWADAHTL